MIHIIAGGRVFLDKSESFARSLLVRIKTPLIILTDEDPGELESYLKWAKAPTPFKIIRM